MGVGSPLLISGLVNGKSYVVRLRAVNAVGVGPASASISVVAKARVPRAPTLVRSLVGYGWADVVFRAPVANGSAPITNYQYSLDDGKTWKVRTPASVSSPLTIGGLKAGKAYTFRLRAVNALGPGPASESVTITPR